MVEIKKIVKGQVVQELFTKLLSLKDQPFFAKYVKNVKYIIDTLNKKFNKKIIYKNNKNILEKKYLNLNSQKATKYLRWNCKYTVLESIKKIIDWEYNFKMNKVSLTIKQIKEHYKKFK